jgi:hypothetical protein
MGGAIALGHPLGATGAIRSATVVHALRRHKLKYGMVTMCVGMGQGAAGAGCQAPDARAAARGGAADHRTPKASCSPPGCAAPRRWRPSRPSSRSASPTSPSSDRSPSCRSPSSSPSAPCWSRRPSGRAAHAAPARSRRRQRQGRAGAAGPGVVAADRRRFVGRRCRCRRAVRCAGRSAGRGPGGALPGATGGCWPAAGSPRPGACTCCSSGRGTRPTWRWSSPASTTWSSRCLRSARSRRANALAAGCATDAACMHVVFAPLPPMRGFPALPQPLRWVAGRDAERHDQALARWAASRADVSRVPMRLQPDPAAMADDGFHPGAPACRRYGQAIAGHIVAHVRPHPAARILETP